MTPHFFRLKAFLTYWLEAVDEHSLHSPFFYDLYTTQIRPAVAAERFQHIENLRQRLLHDKRTISVSDFGSGAHRKSLRSISRMASTCLTPPRFSAMFFRIASAIGARSILELGTSFGINTLYLAENENATITTFEGAPAVADIAALTFEFGERKNIALMVGNIDNTLPAFLGSTRRVDFAFMDANHRYEPTLRYFEWLLKKIHEKSVIVVDDIHYSVEMERAWLAMKMHRLVYGSADLFRCGILFFDPSLNKQHAILQV